MFKSLSIRSCKMSFSYWISMASYFKKTEVKIELLTDIDMLLMVAKAIRGGICNAIHQYAKANNKYMKDYDKNKESSYLKYWDVNNLYVWAISQKLPVNEVEWIEGTSQFNEGFIKNYDEESAKGYLLEVNVQYLKKIHELHNDLQFSPERKKIKTVEKLVTNLYDKNEYDIHIRNLKQALNHGLILKKIHKVIKFNQKDWLKPYTDMNTKIRQKAKNNFEKDFFKLMNNVVFGKTMENVRKYRDIKLVTTEMRRKHLVSEPNYHTTKFVTENFLATEMKKTQILMNKPVHLGLSILDLSKTVMYEFWYDYLKPKYGENAKLCYMDTDSFIVYVKTDNIYKDIAEDAEKIFDTSNFEIDKPLPKEKNEKVIGLIKDELGGQIMKNFVGLRAKTCSYLKDNNDEDKKQDTKMCVIKRKLKMKIK